MRLMFNKTEVFAGPVRSGYDCPMFESGEKGDPRPLEEIQVCADRIVQLGWDEATGGNLSISAVIAPAGWDSMLSGISTISSATLSHLANPDLATAFITTTSGKRWRMLASQPEAFLVHVDPASQWRTCAHHAATGKPPTLELLVHASLQQHCSRRGWTSGAVVHLHPPGLLALSILPTELARAAAAALPWLFPEGALLIGSEVGFVPYLPPGSSALATATCEAMDRSRLVVWQNHGVIASAPDLSAALDVLETAELAARAYLACLQAGVLPHRLSRNVAGL